MTSYRNFFTLMHADTYSELPRYLKHSAVWRYGKLVGVTDVWHAVWRELAYSERIPQPF